MESEVGWLAVIPVKDPVVAKSRLVGDVGRWKEPLAAAFTADTVHAVASCPLVAAVVVVGFDPGVAGAQITVVPDPGEPGVNSAVAAAASWGGERHPDLATLVVPGDLPALRPDTVGALLERASGHDMAVLADLDGRGTTALCAASGAALQPAFGPDSYGRHLALGHAALPVEGLERARRDVDTVTHLRQAIRLGVGPRTAEVVERMYRDGTSPLGGAA